LGEGRVVSVGCDALWLWWDTDGGLGIKLRRRLERNEIDDLVAKYLRRTVLFSAIIGSLPLILSRRMHVRFLNLRTCS
jgi:hypothetical protein